MLIAWGKNDKIFPAAGAEPYKRDLKTLEFHLLDAGHFALETNGDEIAQLMRDFLGKHVGREVTPLHSVARHASYNGKAADAKVPQRRRLHARRESDPTSRKARARVTRRSSAATAGKPRSRPTWPSSLPTCDMFYLGTANAEGQPYIQYRGGPPGFLKVHRRADARLRRLRRQPPVHHARQPVGESQGVHLPDGLREQPAGEALGHRARWSKTIPRCSNGSATRRIPAKSSGRSCSRRSVGRQLPAAHPPHASPQRQIAPVIEKLENRVRELEAELARLRGGK